MSFRSYVTAEKNRADIFHCVKKIFYSKTDVFKAK